MKFIISMGLPHKNVNKLNEGFRFNGARIQILNWSSKKILSEITYTSPPENLGRDLSLMFKGGFLSNDFFYVVTNTEVLTYRIDSWTLEDVLTHPSFNDLHGIFVEEGDMYVINTGLEVVQKFRNGQLLEQTNMAVTPTWERFSKEIDYRHEPTTKPHEAHINHMFKIDDEYWITRFQKRDAVPLDCRTRQQITLPYDAGCHDGLVKKEHIYFTMVNGHIIVVDAITRKAIKDINLNQLSPSKEIGWTRGIEVTGGYAYIGTTAMRFSKYKEYARGLLKGKKNMRMPSTILKVDLLEKNR